MLSKKSFKCLIFISGIFKWSFMLVNEKLKYLVRPFIYIVSRIAYEKIIQKWNSLWYFNDFVAQHLKFSFTTHITFVYSILVV